MAKPSKIEASVAGALHEFGAEYKRLHGKRMPYRHQRAMRELMACRTVAKGGHVVQCGQCSVQEYTYHSCGHRSCPKCGQERGEEWLEARRAELLPVPYFHIVLTVPSELRMIIRKFQKDLYPVLMKAAGQSILELGRNPKYAGGLLGVTAVLHTWSRELAYHPHVHCMVPAAYVDDAGAVHRVTRPRLFPQMVLAKLFRGKLMAMMRAAVRGLRLPGSIALKKWVVHVDVARQGTEVVLRYLSRYIHRTALSDTRILRVTKREVVFRYPSKDRKTMKVMRLRGVEFIRRFLQHVLPDRMHKVRYFGLCARKHRADLAKAREALLKDAPQAVQASPAPPAASPSQPAVPNWLRCPHCKTGERIPLVRFSRDNVPELPLLRHGLPPPILLPP